MQNLYILLVATNLLFILGCSVTATKLEQPSSCQATDDHQDLSIGVRASIHENEMTKVVKGTVNLRACLKIQKTPENRNFIVDFGIAKKFF